MCWRGVAAVACRTMSSSLPRGPAPEPPIGRLFAVAAPGTEDLVASELRALPGTPRIEDVTEQPGGVEWTGDLASLYRANLHLRTASRVLLRVGELRALRFDELRRKAALLPWRRFAGAGARGAGGHGVRLLVSATAHRCRLIHSGALAERVALAIADSGVEVLPSDRPDPADPGRTDGSARSIEKTDGRAADLDGDDGEAGALRVLVRGEADRFVLSVDTSGALLHRRGYRLDAAPAPLRETLAAALLMRLGWSGAGPLCDPTCGSGTILIEAALLAMRRAPGRRRRFAFQDWPGFDARLWRRLLDEAAAMERPLPPGRIFGSDLDARMAAAARENTRRAGLDAEQVRIAVADVTRSRLPNAPGEAGLVLCNPPYGRRLEKSGGQDLVRIYRGLGRFAASRPGERWRLAILTTSPALAAKAGRLRATHRLRNGGLQVHLCEVEPPRSARLVPEDLGEGLAHAADDELHRDGDEQEAHDALQDRAP